MTGNPIVDGLQQVLAAQHLAVYAYPVIGVQVGGDAAGRARTAEAAHRLTRDAVSDQLTALGAVPQAAEPEYRPELPADSAAGAAAWAVAVEEQSSATYRFLLECAVRAGGAQRQLRQQALAGLTGAALAALPWRAMITPDRPSTAFPGAANS